MKQDMTAVLCVAALLMAVLNGCTTAHEEPKAEGTLFAMNTYMTFTVYGPKAQVALDAAREQIGQLESLWSVTESESDIYQANHSGGQAVPVSEKTAKLVAFALELAEETDGALDPTIYPVLTAWGFTADQKQVPPQEQIDCLLPLVDYSQISLSGNTLTVPKGMELDLGAVGKGYAADLAAETLRNYGVESAIFSLGGNIHAIGSRPDGSPWRIGMKAPWGNGTLGVLEVSDTAVVTSGGYENYFTDDTGTVYWHILNPKTGYPAKSGLLSVTIIGPEGRVCDALSTALFVMGAEQAEAYWRNHGGFEMILVTQDYEIMITEGISRQFTPDDERTERVRVIPL